MKRLLVLIVPTILCIGTHSLRAQDVTVPEGSTVNVEQTVGLNGTATIDGEIDRQNNAGDGLNATAGNNTITVGPNGLIRRASSEGINISTDGSESTSATINGTIRSNGNNGILIDANNSSTVTVEIGPTGEVRGNTGNGIEADGSGSTTVTIMNRGTIRNNGAAGIDASTSGTKLITNSGEIRGNGGDGISTGGGDDTITNSGVIRGNGGDGISGGAGSDTITNSGVIRNSTGDGINGAGGNDMIINSGSIFGSTGNGISGGGGDDTLTLQGRSDVRDLIDGGGDTTGDTLNVNVRGLTATEAASVAAAKTAIDTTPGAATNFQLFGTNHNVTKFEFMNFTIEQYANLLPDHLQEFGSFLDNLGGTPDFLEEVLQFLSIAPAGESLNHAVSNLVGLDGIEQFKRESFQWGPDLSRSLGQYFHNLRQGGSGWDTSQVSLYDPNLPLAMQPYANKRLFAGTSMVDGHTDPVNMAKVIEDNAPATDWGGFVQIQGTYSEQDASENYSEADATSVRINAGADKRVTDNLAVGGMIGYSRTDAHVDGLDSEVIDNSVNVGLYTHYSEGNSFVEGMIGYRAHFYEYDRNIIAAPGASANSDTVGHQLPASIRVGHDFKFGEDRQWTFTPQAALHYSLLYMDGYSESGAGALNLIVDDFSAQSLQSEFGFRLAKRYTGTYGWVSPSLYASYNHEFLDENTSVSSRFSGGLTPFRVATADPERDFAVLGIALDGTPADYPCLHFGIRYDVQVGQEDYISHSATAHMRVDL
jgi:uncharacterized protein YhjY with autotransporter beta-barrel domain